MLLPLNPKYQDLYLMTSIAQTEHPHMKRDTEIDSLYFHHRQCHFHLILYIKISIRLHMIIQIEDHVTKHDAED